MEDILKIATKELGVAEIAGSIHNERIIQYAHEIGFTWVNDDETPWCSIFMNWVAKNAGYQKSKSAAARSWLNSGIPITNPEPGDIVIYWRENMNSHMGHVGIFIGFSNDGSRIYTLGGNQGNSVSISGYPKRELLGFRRLIKSGKVILPNKVLRRGDKGHDVVLLQDGLKMANFNVGTSDGDFGQRTENGVKQFQATVNELEISGVFNQETRKYLIQLLNG